MVYRTLLQGSCHGTDVTAGEQHDIWHSAGAGAGFAARIRGETSTTTETGLRNAENKTREILEEAKTVSKLVSSPSSSADTAKTHTAVFASASARTHVEQHTEKQSPQKRPNPTISAIRESLELSSSSFPHDQQMRAALKVLQDSVNFGPNPSGPGDEAFMTWLVSLETLEETPEDEVNHGLSFEHGAIGRYKYAQELKTIEDIGGVRNACRLLAASLQMWRVSTGQIEESGNRRHGPVCGTHIEAVCSKIAAIFKLPSRTISQTADDTGSGAGETLNESSKVAASEEASTAVKASASTSNIGCEKASGHGRNRVAKELDNGIVSEAALRSLEKKAAVALLERNGMTTGKRQ
ncbi:hypothetical protein A4X06_0g5639 [Tilletia controversa]|uniref:Uncharacterized protein n=1 Tax=Tilletia controversa TaxID=13291 RepID=A0A8X7MQ35_9BASI|nr:hypothetical protein A4X06_0g5639 [Tilletia controversa]